MRLTPLSGPLIIGGGPAGAAAAITLSRAGRPVTLIERHHAASDKVCGDFVSTEAIALLEKLGIDLSAAAPIRAIRLIYRKQIAVTQLPFPALGLTRRALDEALLRQAEASGATVLRGHRVGAIEPDGTSLRLPCATLGQLGADTVFLATGKHELRGAARISRPNGLLGMKMYYALDPAQCDALRGHVELVLFEGGYAGLQLVEASHAVLCVLVSRDRLHAVGGGWRGLLQALCCACPHLQARLAHAEPLLDRTLAIAGLPYGYLYTPDRQALPGVFRLGDQAAVIGSLTGDGVSLALASGQLAAHTWLAGGDAALYHRRLTAGISRQMRRASVIHHLCLNQAAQPWLAAACGAWPGLMRLAATVTRATRLTHSRYAV